MRVGVVIGRFQVIEPTSGHRFLLDTAAANSDKLVIVIGDAPLFLTDRNPLSYDMRVSLLKMSYANASFCRLEDNRSDEIWSQNLDRILSQYENDEVMLFASRDSFVPYYSGKYKTQIIPEVPNISATNQRKNLATIDRYNDLHSDKTYPAFLHGIIYAVENRFPTAYGTVDVALLRQTHDKKIQLLLGKKPGRDQYVFIGGFIDPIDETKESAASRELHEELGGNVQTHEYKYICSRKIDDFRYKGTKDGIMTTFFATWYMGGTPVASDDIEEIKWFNMDDFNPKGIISPNHIPLYEELVSYLNAAKKFKVDFE